MAIEESAADLRNKRREIPKSLLEASRQKFLHFGAHRATMADISREVGMPRQTIYEYVSSRDDLIEAVLVQRILEIADLVKPHQSKSFANSLVDTAVSAIRIARNDPELMNLVTTAPKGLVQRVIVGRHQEVHDIVKHLFAPILDRGFRAGLVRTDKPDDEIIDWFRIVFLALITQVGIDPDQEQSFVADFLLPSIAASHQPAAAARSRSKKT